MRIIVECYAGYRADEEPRRFFIGKDKIEVASVIERWATPQDRFFRVKGDDGLEYLLRQRADKGGWELA